MAIPIEAAFISGQTLYAIIHNQDGTVWNTGTVAFEAYNAAHWSVYAVALTEQGSTGYYSATYPSGINRSGNLTTETLYQQKDVSPAVTDAPPLGMSQTQGVNVSPGQIIIKKNTAFAGFPFLMISSADHITPKVGLTITATRSIDGAAFGACANAAVEVGSGIYVIDLAASDLNGDAITLEFVGTGADKRFVTILPQN